MGRELILLRHGKSAWDRTAPSDFERPLAKRGRRDAPRMGNWLAQQGMKPDRIVSSPALRAYQTALRVACELGIPPEDIEFDRRIYEATAMLLMQVIKALDPGWSTVLMVGHNPGFDQLTELLCGEVPRREDGKLMTTAAVAVLSLPARWNAVTAGCGTVVGIYRPRELFG